MSEHGGDYRIIVRVKNGRLLRAMEKAGIRTQVELAKLSGVHHSTVGKLANLTAAAMSKRGDWLKAVIDISAALRCMPEDIVPDAHRYLALTKSTVSFDTDIDEIGALIDSHSSDLERLTDVRKVIGSALAALSPRERKAIECRFGLDGGGEDTLEAVGRELGVSKDRAHQLVERALHKLGSSRTAVGRSMRRYVGIAAASDHDERKRAKSDWGLPT